MYPIVDLKRSEWDRRKSNPKMGEYYFDKKVMYKNKDFKEGIIHPYKIKWCKYSEQDYPRPFATLYEWKLEFGAELLTVGDDYWPDGWVPDAEGKYVRGDLVCVKIPIGKHMQKRREASDLAERMGRSMKSTFKGEMKQEGADIPDEWIDDKEEKTRKEFERYGM